MALNLFERFRVSKDFFEFNLTYLFLVGLWPEKLTKNQLFLYKIYQNILHTFSIIFLLITGIKNYQIRNDLIVFLSNIDKSLVALNYFFKVIYFLLRRQELKRLVDDISQSGDRVKKESRDNMIKLPMLITMFTSGVMLGFSLFGLYSNEMSVEAWLPFEARKNKMNMALSLQIIAVLFCIPFSYRAIGMQGMVCSLLIYLCDQLVGLQEALKNFEYSKENERTSRDGFKKIIMKHIRLMRYARSMERMFKEYFLIQNLAVTMELSLNAVTVTAVGTQEKFMFGGFLAFLGLALLNAYLYCYLGNKLIDESTGVALAAYSSAWPTWPKHMQRNILFIIRAAQEPLKMTAGGMAIISMQTYGAALYNGYSLFAVLNDVVDVKP